MGALAFLRISGILFVLPIIGDSPTPVRARILTALALTIGLQSVIPVSWAPALTVDGRLHLSGTVDSPAPLQSLHLYDGFAWHRLPADTVEWSETFAIPATDKRTLTVRAVARDAHGNVRHQQHSLVLDTLAPAPELFANLAPYGWHTDLAPTLTITWTVADGRGRVLSVRAMGERAWRRWFEAHYGDVIADRQETSEA